MTVPTNILCPNCKSILQHAGQTMSCANGHSFDQAKEGYINLLLANQKKKANPGDNKLMIDAREAFLATGSFDFLLAELESTIDSMNVGTGQAANIKVLDLGCGSGYYTRNLLKTGDYNKLGIDISKAAIAKAARKDKTSTYLVGSVFDLPIAANTVDLTINIFSPVDISETIRILAPNGYYLKVVPAGDHMKEIAELVYETFKPHTSTITAAINTNPKLQFIEAKKLQKSITLRGSNLINFISMTPYFYKFGENHLKELQALAVTLSFEIIIAQRTETILPCT